MITEQEFNEFISSLEEGYNRILVFIHGRKSHNCYYINHQLIFHKDIKNNIYGFIIARLMRKDYGGIDFEIKDLAIEYLDIISYKETINIIQDLKEIVPIKLNDEINKIQSLIIQE